MGTKWQSLSASMVAATAVILFLFANAPLSSSSPGSVSQLAIGRKLMQTPQNCPVNFEFANYTTLTSRCKGPLYPANICCAAFKDFACPYADDINNLNTDCSSTMFSYINLNGHYPPGLFSSECRDGKLGLVCPADLPSQSKIANGSPMSQDNTLQLLSLSCLCAIVFLLF